MRLSSEEEEDLLSFDLGGFISGAALKEQEARCVCLCEIGAVIRVDGPIDD